MTAALLLSTLLLFSCSARAQAAGSKVGPSKPDFASVGYRDIPWGTPYDQVLKKFPSAREKEGNIVVMDTFAGIEAELTFLFLGHGTSAVYVDVRTADSNCPDLAVSLTEKYLAPLILLQWIKEGTGPIMNGEWLKGDTIIGLTCAGGSVSVKYSSKNDSAADFFQKKDL